MKASSQPESAVDHSIFYFCKSLEDTCCQCHEAVGTLRYRPVKREWRVGHNGTQVDVDARQLPSNLPRRWICRARRKIEKATPGVECRSGSAVATERIPLGRHATQALRKPSGISSRRDLERMQLQGAVITRGHYPEEHLRPHVPVHARNSVVEVGRRSSLGHHRHIAARQVEDPNGSGALVGSNGNKETLALGIETRRVYAWQIVGKTKVTNVRHGTAADVRGAIDGVRARTEI